MRHRASVVRTSQTPIGGVSVLFVDRSPDERELFATRFAAECARLTTAWSAGEALTILERGEIELLVTEVRLPGCDGFELLRRMRRLSWVQAGAVPAIAATTARTPGEVDGLLQCGFASVVLKPYATSDLLAAVAEVSTVISVLRRLRMHVRAGYTMQTEHDLGFT